VEDETRKHSTAEKNSPLHIHNTAAAPLLLLFLLLLLKIHFHGIKGKAGQWFI
jgi:hypothetical protein